MSVLKSTLNLPGSLSTSDYFLWRNLHGKTQPAGHPHTTSLIGSVNLVTESVTWLEFVYVKVDTIGWMGVFHGVSRSTVLSASCAAFLCLKRDSSIHVFKFRSVLVLVDSRALYISYISFPHSNLDKYQLYVPGRGRSFSWRTSNACHNLETIIRNY